MKLPIPILFFVISIVLWPGPATASASPTPVVLGEGKTRQLQWRISAVRIGQGSPKRPCLIEQNLISGGYSQGVECGVPAPPGEDPLLTQFSASFDRRPGGKMVGATSMGLVFATDVERVSLDLVPGPGQTRRTRLLNSTQARKSGLAPFRYLAFGVARDACLERVTGFNSAGEQILNMQRPCAAGGPSIEAESPRWAAGSS